MQVDIWSDVVCPWCAVGKARFESALDDFDHADEVEVRWRSFELDPSRPAVAADVDYVDLLAGKYGTTRDQAQGMVDRMTAAGAADGVEFRFDRARPANTFDAHRVLHLAADRGRQHQVKARLLTGHHTEGVAIGDHGELVRLATEAGLDADDVGAVLASDDYADAVRADEDEARRLGISGVPFFVFDGRHGVSGAQPADVLGRVLTQVHEASDRPATDGARHEHATGAACDDESCAM